MMTAVIVQARMGSTRLPGKIARPILGKPMLARQLERLALATKPDVILVATSDRQEDNVTEKIAKDAGFECFRGSETDVLDRYYQAARSVNAEVVVRITGDCPLYDPDVLDLVVERYQESGVDYTTTPANYPEGLDTEVFSFAALEDAWKNARLPSEREHVTPYIRNHPERFKLDSPWTQGSFNYSMYHWSVDTDKDFAFVTKIYEELGDATFGMDDVLDLLQKKPELVEINKGGTGFEGLEKSLREDEEWKNHHA